MQAAKTVESDAADHEYSLAASTASASIAGGGGGLVGARLADMMLRMLAAPLYPESEHRRACGLSLVSIADHVAARASRYGQQELGQESRTSRRIVQYAGLQTREGGDLI